MLTELSDELTELDDDPRLDTEFCRAVPGSDTLSEVLLVGVVHDHPASRYRVEQLAEAFDPATVALELPPLAVPAFERGRLGDDEMSAAIAAVPAASVVGIDSLGVRFGRRFVGNVAEMDASLRTVRRALGEIRRIGRHAVECRLGLEEMTATRDKSVGESPAKQADDERTQVARSRSLLGAIERPQADLLVDATREDTMASSIADLRHDGSVLAVIGMDHLDRVAEAVDATADE
jgi:pheromone shutdown protein TraB